MVFSSEKFMLAVLAVVKEVEASSLLPKGHCSRRAKPAAPRREEGGGEEEVWAKRSPSRNLGEK